MLNHAQQKLQIWNKAYPNQYWKVTMTASIEYYSIQRPQRTRWTPSASSSIGLCLHRYDRVKCAWRYILDTQLICAMAPPGGARAVISSRTQSRFNVLNLTVPNDSQVMLLLQVGVCSTRWTISLKINGWCRWHLPHMAGIGWYQHVLTWRALNRFFIFRTLVFQTTHRRSVGFQESLAHVLDAASDFWHE